MGRNHRTGLEDRLASVQHNPFQTKELETLAELSLEILTLRPLEKMERTNGSQSRLEETLLAMVGLEERLLAMVCLEENELVVLL